MAETSVIFDIGANNGDDLPYYLLKADKVIAIEANPALCAEIRERFPDEIAQGRLIVESCVIVGGESSGTVAFHVHASNHVLSRRGAPFRRKDQYRRIELPAKSMRALVEDHGEPEYAKIDIEGGEDDLVRALFALGVRPRFLSVEAHRIEAFLRIVADGAYDKFQLVEGARVAETYRDHEIGAREGRAKYSFPHHSAGPFGDDIRGEWVDAETMFQRLLAEGLGWKDVHARRREASEAPTRSRLLSLWVRWSRWFRWYRRNPAKRLREVVSSD